jgi:predicted DNA-binding ribbon-helix-helix protein
MARKPTDEVQLKLRFSEALRKKLDRAADQGERSLNAEIIHRLEHSFTDEADLTVEIKSLSAKLGKVEAEMESFKRDLFDRWQRGQSPGGEQTDGSEGLPVVERSIVIAGHKTSVSLEDAFWKGLKEIAGGRDMTLSELVATIDSECSHGNLAAAIRLFVLDHYRRINSAEPPIKKRA